MPLSIIGVDADDTLWHTETVFRLTHKRFNELLADFADEDTLEARLAAIERENMKAYGYGAKGFTLSMLQTALEVSDGNVSTKVIRELLDAGREMMTHPIEPLPGVEDALKALKERGRLVLITKGDLFHQEMQARRLRPRLALLRRRDRLGEDAGDLHEGLRPPWRLGRDLADDRQFGEVRHPARCCRRRLCGPRPLPAGLGA